MGTRRRSQKPLCPRDNKPGAIHKLRRSWTFWSPDCRGQPNAAAGPPFSSSNPWHQQAFLRASRRWSFTQKETAGLVALELGQRALQSYPVSVECLTVLQLSTRALKLPCQLLKVACEDWLQNYRFLPNALEISISQGRGVPTAQPLSSKCLMNVRTNETVNDCPVHLLCNSVQETHTVIPALDPE